jgi:signal transduction histidine kinase
MEVPPEARHRARFDALRLRLFEEMARAMSRWRLLWLVPFQLFVLAVLVVGGMPSGRAAIQGALVGLSLVAAATNPRCPTRKSTFGQLMFGTLLYFGVVLNTGGVASPLLASGMPLLISAAVQPIGGRPRGIYFLSFAAGFALVGVLSTGPLGQLLPPLSPVGAWPSVPFVIVGAMSMIFAAGSVLRVGQGVTEVYERIAFELAARREEICTESEDRTKALEGIAARLAHEVKNPLAAIKGLSTHMARSATDQKMAERLSIVAAEADRLQSIVDGFLSFSRGLEALSVAPTKPYDISRELSMLLETRASDAEVTLEVSGSPELTVNADARKVRQALLNLVLNAMQASPRGEAVTIEVGKVAGSCTEGGAFLRVKDRGQGMTPEVLERIKRPYFTTREGGSGLGIAVARGLAEQHGGRLEYESAPGKGTTATIWLPMCAMAAAKKAELPNPVEHRPEPAVTA